MKGYTILIFAQNKRGVIERVSMLLRKKMYNINQFSTSDTKNSEIKKITIKLYNLDDSKISQILKQLRKIVEIIRVICINQKSAIENEMILIKVNKGTDFFYKSKMDMIYEADNTEIYRYIDTPDNIEKLILKYRQNKKITDFTTSGTIAIEK